MRHSSREIMLDPHMIVYKCPQCNTVFHNIPKDECEFCNKKFDMRDKNERKGTPIVSKFESDYRLW